MKKPVIGITTGDPAGIGPEVTVKALTRPQLYERALPVVIGDYQAVADAIAFCHTGQTIHVITEARQAQGAPGVVDLIDLGLLQPRGWSYGQVSALCGEAAFRYVTAGIDLAMAGKLDAVVTGPINKEAIHLAGHPFSGHTEIFAHYTQTKDYAMLLTTPALKVIHVTTHVSMRKACGLITAQRVLTVIRLAHQALKALGYASPRIAVAGLNPHCSENGLFGDEEARHIIPAVRQAALEGLCVEGPLPPDSIFVKAMAGQYDIVVAMYHDQGHIPVKLAGFRMDPKTGALLSMEGVNITVGLPIIRASVDHGTAFDRAGTDQSNEGSMADAIEAAVQMAEGAPLL